MSQLSKREAASILGVWEDAGEKDIKLAYKKLAIRWHPGIHRQFLILLLSIIHRQIPKKSEKLDKNWG